MRLHKEEALSPEKIADKFSKEQPPGDRPPPRTIRNWLGGGTAKARQLIEATARRSIDSPLVSWALKQHHDEIRNLIEKWQLELQAFTMTETDYPKVEVANNGLPFDINYVEHNRLFTSLNEHIANKELWSKYSNLKNTFREAIKTHDIVINELMTVAKTWPNIQLGKDFLEPFYDIIAPLSILSKDDLPYLDVHDREQFTIEWKAEDNFLLASRVKSAELYTVLKASNPLNYIENYESMCKQLLQSEEVLRLISLSKKVWKLEGIVYDLISEVLLSRSYIMRTCKLCQELSKT